jgi:pimeloyl-ACP methyl ester carboxylesterase
VRFVKRRLTRQLQWLYQTYVGDGGVSLSPDMDSDSRTLLLTFGGLGSSGGEPSFEFGSISSEIPVKRLFVRDPHQSWYHRGTPQQGTSLESVAESLGALLAQHDIDRLVVVGNSAGGYAALVFGTLLGADTVLSFAPQTVLDCDVLAEMGDHRWDWRLKPLTAKGALEKRWTDLRVALPPARHTDTRYKIYFDETIPGDHLHAECLRGIEGVQLYRFGRGGHDLVRELRDCGALERVLREALHVPGPTAVRGPGSGPVPSQASRSRSR